MSDVEAVLIQSEEDSAPKALNIGIQSSAKSYSNRKSSAAVSQISPVGSKQNHRSNTKDSKNNGQHHRDMMQDSIHDEDLLED